MLSAKSRRGDGGRGGRGDGGSDGDGGQEGCGTRQQHPEAGTSVHKAKGGVWAARLRASSRSTLEDPEFQPLLTQPPSTRRRVEERRHRLGRTQGCTAW